jgi:hypothetical protein
MKCDRQAPTDSDVGAKNKRGVNLNRFVISASLLIALAATPAPAQTRVGNVVSGRAKLQLLYRYNAPQPLPKPERVLIQDFATEGDVVLEMPRIRHHLLLRDEAGNDLTPDELVQQISDTFAKTLIQRLAKEKVTAERSEEATTAAEPEIVIQGQFIGINQGNSRKRIMIGFGRGASDIKTHVVITLVANGKTTVLVDCNINSQSGKEPGALASTGGIGIAAGTVVGSLDDKRSATVEADASRMGKLVADLLESVMNKQKWIATAN